MELAGGTIQCPECGLLADIPTLGDLPSILPDGTYQLDEPDSVPVYHFAQAMHAFNRNTLDALGNEKDLRPTMDDFQRAGVNEPVPTGHPLNVAPKYDPETGELIRPLVIVPREEDAADIPIAKAAINYALPGLAPRISPAKVYLELLTPTNTFVMAIILVFHIMLQVCILTLSILFPVVGLFFMAIVIIAHYGCVIEDIGREEIDELPRPLRNLSLADDLWMPFYNVVAAFLLCYTPAIIANLRLEQETRGAFFVLGSLLMLGTILMPAVLLTMLTSGSVLNLRPDRVLGVIRNSGWNYVLIAFQWALAIGIYVTGVYGCNYSATMMLPIGGAHVSRRVWMGSILLLLLGIYLMHAFCWQIGLLYRAKNLSFPWVLQRHMRLSKQEKLATIKKIRQG